MFFEALGYSDPENRWKLSLVLNFHGDYWNFGCLLRVDHFLYWQHYQTFQFQLFQLFARRYLHNLNSAPIWRLNSVLKVYFRSWSIHFDMLNYHFALSNLRFWYQFVLTAIFPILIYLYIHGVWPFQSPYLLQSPSSHSSPPPAPLYSPYTAILSPKSQL